MYKPFYMLSEDVKIVSKTSCTIYTRGIVLDPDMYFKIKGLPLSFPVN